MNVVNLRTKLIKSIEQQVEKELDEFPIPPEVLDTEEKLLLGRKKEDLNWQVMKSISAAEETTLRNLIVNNNFRYDEFEQAMGMLLIGTNTPIDTSFFSEIFSGLPHSDDAIDAAAGYTRFFWTSYGNFNIMGCSLLDSIGIYLAFVFFGLVDAPLYFNQVLEAIRLKYGQKKRIVLEGDPFTVEQSESWKVLCEALKRYREIRRWRDETAHAFSPLMYQLDSWDPEETDRRKILRSPKLDTQKVIKNAKETYYLLYLVPLAANILAESFIGTHSYHRNFSRY